MKNITQILPGIKTVLQRESLCIDDLLNQAPRRFSSIINFTESDKNNNQLRPEQKSAEKRRASRIIVNKYDLQLEEMDDSNFFRLKLIKVIDNQRRINLDELGSSFMASTPTHHSRRNYLDSHNNFYGSHLQQSFTAMAGLCHPFEFKLSKNLEIVFEGLQGTAVKSGLESSLKGAQRLHSPTNNQSNQLSVVAEEDDMTDLVNSLRIQIRDQVNSLRGGSSCLIDLSSARVSKKEDYGAGIRIKRLFDGFIRDVYDEEEEEILEELENEAQGLRKRRGSTGSSPGRGSSVFKFSTNRGVGSSIFTNGSGLRLYSQKQLDSIAKKRDKRIGALRCFWCCWVVLITLSIVTVGYNFMRNLSDTQATSGLITLERSASKVSSLLQSILGRVNDLCLLNQGVDLLYDSEYRGRLRQQKLEAIEALKKEYQQLILTHNRFEEMPQSADSYQLVKQEKLKKIVTLKINNKMLNFTYKNALYNTLSVVAKIVNKDIESIGFSDIDVEFIRYNIANGLHSAIIRVVHTNKVARKMILKTQNVFIWKGTLVFFVTNFILILITFGTVHFSQKAKERAVQCFYGFSDEYIENIIGVCEKFNTFIQEDCSNFENGGTCQLNISDSDHSGSSANKVNHEKSLNKSKRKNKKKNSEFIKLKKRKKKGTLVRHCGAWELTVLISISLNLIFFWFKVQTHVSTIVEAVDNSRYIYHLNLMYVLPYAMRNTYIAVLIDPKSKARGKPSIAIARFYDNLIINYSNQLINVTRAHFILLAKKS